MKSGRGRKKTEKEMQSYTFVMEKQDYEELMKLAKEDSRSLAEFLRIIIKKYLTSNKNKK